MRKKETYAMRTLFLSGSIYTRIGLVKKLMYYKYFRFESGCPTRKNSSNHFIFSIQKIQTREFI